jgi:hypothetical protein
MSERIFHRREYARGGDGERQPHEHSLRAIQAALGRRAIRRPMA